jgi:hypothetical protein
MNTFLFIALVVTSLFVLVILIIDHIEVARHARTTQYEVLQQWKAEYDLERRRQAFLDGIGYRDATDEEISRLAAQQENIRNILNTM